MDIVYPIAKISQWGNFNELRFSLRSIEKHVPHGRIFIIGHCPDWVTNISHIPHVDSYVTKDSNIISKVLRVCYEDIAPQFIRLSDDQFFLSPFKEAYYYNGDLNYSKDRSDKQWIKRCFNTKDVLLSEKKPIYNYDCHVPQIIDKKKYVDVMLQSTFGQGVGLLVNSYYFNSIFPQLTDSHQQPDKVNDFLSIGEKVGEDVRQRLYSLFPDKSKYEI